MASAKERSLSIVRGAVAASPGTGSSDADAQQDPQLTERASVSASYAKLQAQIANVVARLDPPRQTGGQSLAASADQALMSLMPQPVILLPMPPTDQHMIDFIAQVAQSLAQQAAMARAAQAHVSPAVVDTLLH